MHGTSRVQETNKTSCNPQVHLNAASCPSADNAILHKDSGRNCAIVSQQTPPTLDMRRCHPGGFLTQYLQSFNDDTSGRFPRMSHRRCSKQTNKQADAKLRLHNFCCVASLKQTMCEHGWCRNLAVCCCEPSRAQQKPHEFGAKLSLRFVMIMHMQEL